MPEGAEILRDALKENKTVTKLNLTLMQWICRDDRVTGKENSERLSFFFFTDNKFGNAGITSLCEALSVNTTLTWLSFAGEKER